MINEELKKRLLSFAWRLGAYIVVSALSFIVQNLGDFSLSPAVNTFIALVVGELTKWLNTKYQLGKAMMGAFRK